MAPTDEEEKPDASSAIRTPRSKGRPTAVQATCAPFLSKSTTNPRLKKPRRKPPPCGVDHDGYVHRDDDIDLFHLMLSFFLEAGAMVAALHQLGMQCK
jgi:hypothetical protein